MNRTAAKPPGTASPLPIPCCPSTDRIRTRRSVCFRRAHPRITSASLSSKQHPQSCAPPPSAAICHRRGSGGRFPKAQPFPAARPHWPFLTMGPKRSVRTSRTVWSIGERVSCERTVGDHAEGMRGARRNHRWDRGKHSLGRNPLRIDVPGTQTLFRQNFRGRKGAPLREPQPPDETLYDLPDDSGAAELRRVREEARAVRPWIAVRALRGARDGVHV
ncbi:hypothetical protein DFJ74DRAFT_674982 [Hyaloraphidium curvatum]|nr:hypothetical protein DFJ74DRAFT_674982 [Hyaloraphidium curvatum]